MRYRKILIFVEGDNDKEFFQRVLRNRLEKKYGILIPWKHRQKPDKEINKGINHAINKGYEHIFTVDNDYSSQQCLKDKRNEIRNRFSNLDENRIVIVIKEIESWLLAGLSGLDCERLGIEPITNTDNIGKKKFNEFARKKFDSGIVFRSEIFNNYDIEIAKTKNASFRRFCDKFL